MLLEGGAGGVTAEADVHGVGRGVREGEPVEVLVVGGVDRPAVGLGLDLKDVQPHEQHDNKGRRDPQEDAAAGAAQPAPVGRRLPLRVRAPPGLEPPMVGWAGQSGAGVKRHPGEEACRSASSAVAHRVAFPRRWAGSAPLSCSGVGGVAAAMATSVLTAATGCGFGELCRGAVARMTGAAWGCVPRAAVRPAPVSGVVRRVESRAPSRSRLAGRRGHRSLGGRCGLRGCGAGRPPATAVARGGGG